MTEVLGGQVPLDVMVETVTLGARRTSSLASCARSRSPPSAASAPPPTCRPSRRRACRATESSRWFGIAAPAGTPPAVVERLNRELRKVLDEAEVQKRLSALGGGLRADRPRPEMRAQVQTEVERWKKLVESRRIEKQ